jgi:hypothetical protein
MHKAGFVVGILLWSSMANSYAAPHNIFNASHVMQSLWQLPIDTFNETFASYVDQYSSYNQEFLKLTSCQKFVRHCRILHNFFKRLMVDEYNDSLVYGDLDLSLMPATHMPLFTYWHVHRFKAGYDFYALYFDCISRLFVVAIHEAQMQKATMKYTECKARADHYHAELSMILKQLIGSTYEERYTRQLNRYFELLALVQVENQN